MPIDDLSDEWPLSRELYQRTARSLGGGVSTGLRASMKPHPLFIERGLGSRLYDVDGHELIDYVLGWGPVILGHAHPRLVSAVAAQLPLGQTFGTGHHLEYEVAERVCAAMPGVERVLWSNTGSEAAQIALRLARAATGRRRFLKFGGHYHGWSDAMLIGYRPDADGRLDSPASRGQHPRATEDVTVLPWNDIAAAEKLLRDPGQDLAAVFIEPVLCNSGVLSPADGFLEALRAICDDTGTVLVFDEVITGFRIAYGGAAERFGVRPDLVVLAKAIAAGFPLAAVGGRADLIEQTTAGVVHAGTYNGNPVVLAAAAATIDELARPGTYEQFEALGARLAAGLADACTAHGVPAAVHQAGPVVQLIPGMTSATSFDDYLRGDWAWYDRLTVELLHDGIFTLPGGRWYLSTAHSAADVDQTVTAFEAALKRTPHLGGPERR